MKFTNFISDIIDSLSDYGFIIYHDTTFIQRYQRSGNIPLLAESLKELYNDNNDSHMTHLESISLSKSLINGYIL